MDGERGRSYEVVEDGDLERLAVIAAADRRRFFRTRLEYAGRFVCAALCQGAGQHVVDVVRGQSQPNGIKDFDVWSFFAALPGQRFPANRRLTRADFGPSRFGRWDGAPERFRHYEGRRVDLLLRALPVETDDDPVTAVQDWLRAAATDSACALARKGVVLVDPSPLRGRIVWPA